MEDSKLCVGKVAACAILALGLAMCGFLIGTGVRQSREPVRTVTVKGLAEQDVRADLALWSIHFVRSGNDLSKTRAEIMNDDATVTKFLQKQGIADAVISRKVNVIDKNAQQWGDGNPAPIRFVLTSTIMLRTDKIELVEKAYANAAQLIDSGIVLTSDGDSTNAPVYIFNGLTKLKPSMIAEANKNARETAAQFAKDSNSSLGKILTADQGVFQILPRDNAPMLQEAQQTDKTIRVVVTIKYQLK